MHIEAKLQALGLVLPEAPKRANSIDPEISGGGPQLSMTPFHNEPAIADAKLDLSPPDRMQDIFFPGR